MEEDSFADVMRQRLQQRDGDQQIIGFESRCVRAILKFGNVSGDVSGKLALARINHGKAKLDLEWFNREHPNFPATLIADKLEKTYDIAWAGLFGPNFFKQAWTKAYFKAVELQEYDLEKDWVALMFKVPHAKNAEIMVLHNKPGNFDTTDIADVETRIVRKYSTESSAILIIESLQSFVASTGATWQEQ